MRADRLISLMLTLYARGRMTAQELAEQLEVSERTIYRDIDALSMAGVPVYTQPGSGGGIFLDEDYRVSLTGLSRVEVQSLFVSAAVRPLHDLGMDGAVENSLMKLFAALPAIQRQEVERARQRLYIDGGSWFRTEHAPPSLPALQAAVWDDRRVHLRYIDSEGNIKARTVDAVALVAKANMWYLVARRDDGTYRNYRAARCEEVQILDERFERDPSFELGRYWVQSVAHYEQNATALNPPYIARLRVHPDLFWVITTFLNGRFIREDSTNDPDGWICVRVEFTDIYEGRMRALGLSVFCEVLEPAELRRFVIQTARDVLTFYGEAL